MTYTLDKAIVYTLAYSDIFNFPLTAKEIQHFLIGILADPETVRQHLENPSEWLQFYIENHHTNGQTWYALTGRGAIIFPLRHEREKISQELLKKARYYARWLGRLPFVRMVALTGALAVKNARDSDDDLDYMLVVKEGRVWLARLFAVALVRVCKLRGVILCPNYVLAETAMGQKQHDLFMAHEITQMIPVVGHEYYLRMRQSNRWVDLILPNAMTPLYPEADLQPRAFSQIWRRTAEWLLGGRIGNWLETLEYRRKMRKFADEISRSVDSHLDQQQVKGHFMDYGYWTMQKFQERIHILELPPLEHLLSSAAD